MSKETGVLWLYSDSWSKCNAQHEIKNSHSAFKVLSLMIGDSRRAEAKEHRRLPLFARMLKARHVS